jgi:hypothetical protein
MTCRTSTGKLKFTLRARFGSGLCGHGEWGEIAEAETVTWTRITDPDEAASLLPAWFGSRMIGLRGRFGLVGPGNRSAVSALRFLVRQ